MVRRALLVSLVGAALVAGCGGKDAATTSASGAPATACPKAWKAGWQKLADDVGAAVFCPSWMPEPVDARIGGAYKNGRWVDKKDRSYLVSFLWLDSDAGVSSEVHLNFRGYPGRTSIPKCQTTRTVKGKTVHGTVPCFADRGPTKKLGPITATVYTVNQGIDEWHVLYLWRYEGSLYTVSEHVVAPYSYSEVVSNLERIIRGFVRLEPTT
jgi:hypothetical protein